MEIEILAHGNTSQARIDLLKNAAAFYADYLNLTDFKYKVLIHSAPNIRRSEKINGFCSKISNNEIIIAIDSALQLPRTLLTLAHEMVHAKQYMRGQYRHEWARNGKVKSFWLGKQYTVKYIKRPWEVEAFRRQSELTIALMEAIIQKKKKSKN